MEANIQGKMEPNRVQKQTQEKILNLWQSALESNGEMVVFH